VEVPQTGSATTALPVSVLVLVDVWWVQPGHKTNGPGYVCLGPCFSGCLVGTPPHETAKAEDWRENVSVLVLVDVWWVLHP